MTGLDEHVDLERMRDLRGRTLHPWIRGALVALLAVPVLLALTGTIGHPSERGRPPSPARACGSSSPTSCAAG
jgi:hypothetical protein